ncbi:hypothetical protein GCM10023224_04680 [Streptomonospora halophila]|uniref:Uncharacterized protein n=1 Tax=Streptomonospora halophila TaxID=427369 RepID=A0ABP9G5M1_9ACTN
MATLFDAAFACETPDCNRAGTPAGEVDRLRRRIAALDAAYTRSGFAETVAYRAARGHLQEQVRAAT